MLINKNAFTLIETLFVLFIMCILFSLSCNLHMPTINDQLILDEATQFLNEAKIVAMTTKETVTVKVSGHNLSYTSNDHNSNLTLEEITFDTYQFTLNNMGNIKTAKTINCKVHQNKYSFVYQLGSGYFYVK
ncbi:MAG: type II secretion system GspH family protein [Erysipelotrichaceae bacterium]|nr:type II secretion system GspH family protein [Erysipelotrichaceae bacterium]